MIRSRDERKCRLAAVQERRQGLETEVKELAAQSRRHASDLNAIRASLKHLIEQRDTIIGYDLFLRRVLRNSRPCTRTADILTQSVIWRTWAVC